MKNGWGAGEDGTTQRGAFNTKSPYLNLRDMFDGGGAGKSGKEFEGGGMLSFFANMLGKPLSPQEAAEAPQAADPQPQPTVSGRGYITPPAAPKQYSGRGDVGMPTLADYTPDMVPPMQMPNLMDTMADARGNRAADAIQFAADYPVNTMQYGGRGSYGMPQQTNGPRRSMTLQDQKEAEIRAYLSGLK